MAENSLIANALSVLEMTQDFESIAFLLHDIAENEEADALSRPKYLDLLPGLLYGSGNYIDAVRFLQ